MFSKFLFLRNQSNRFLFWDCSKPLNKVWLTFSISPVWKGINSVKVFSKCMSSLWRKNSKRIVFKNCSLQEIYQETLTPKRKATTSWTGTTEEFSKTQLILSLKCQNKTLQIYIQFCQTEQSWFFKNLSFKNLRKFFSQRPKSMATEYCDFSVGHCKLQTSSFSWTCF